MGQSDKETMDDEENVALAKKISPEISQEWIVVTKFAAFKKKKFLKNGNQREDNPYLLQLEVSR